MNNFKIVNVDTDSISFSKPDGSSFTEEERKLLLKDLNSNFPEKIVFEDDGYYDKIIVLKAKNYILFQQGKIKIKGSSLRSSKTEKGLKDFMQEIIQALIYDRQDDLINIYHKYIREVFNVEDISRWTKKHTITDAVLNPTRTNEQKVLDALGGMKVQPGDKYYLYFTNEKSLALQETWDKTHPNHDSEVLLKKLYQTLVIFKNVLDINMFPKYHLKNKKIKEQLLEVIKNEKR